MFSFKKRGKDKPLNLSRGIKCDKMDAPALVLMCAGTATRYNYLGTANSIPKALANEAVVTLKGSQITGFKPDEKELSIFFKSDNQYYVKNDDGILKVYDTEKVKNVAEVGPNKERFIEYSLKQFKDCGGNYAVIVVREETERHFVDVFGKDGTNFNGITIRYAHQTIPEGRRKPKGTVDAALCAMEHVNNRNVIVCNGDDIYHGVFRILFENPANDNEIVIPGYYMRDCVPRENKDGVTRAPLRVNEQNRLIECPELEKVVWEDDAHLIDLESKTSIQPDDMCSMNIFSLSPKIFKAMQEMDKSIPYEDEAAMKARFRGRTEFLLIHFLGEIIKDKRFSCDVIPFDGITYGLTKRTEVGMVAKRLLADYHDNDSSKPLWG